MKPKYVKVIVPSIAVIASVTCMFAYRPPSQDNQVEKIQKYATPPADNKSIHDANRN